MEHVASDLGGQAASYLGVVPGENSSSEQRRITGITKAGSRQTRWARVQAAWSFMRWAKDDDRVRRGAMQVMQRRGKNVAGVALAHKLATILYALWRDGSRYRSHPEG